MRVLASAFLSSALLLTGCSTLQTTAAPSSSSGVVLKGMVHGGQAPITGAHVYLMAANTTGYGGNGMPASALNQSLSLLNVANTGLSDSIGAYVSTDATGSFSITGDYSCATGQQVYLLALGGNAGSGVNSSIGLMAALGNCPSVGNFNTVGSGNYIPFIWINEVTTASAAYAFAGFATDATHVSTVNGTQALLGMRNAFANSGNIVNIATGAALTTTPAGNGTVNTTTLNTTANILASCINSNGAVTAAQTGPPAVPATSCYTLFGNTTSNGKSTGTQPTETATAAINLAHFPAKNLTALYALQAGIAAPFAPNLTSQPLDLTIDIKFTGGGLSAPQTLAVDANGQVWITDNGGGVEGLTELSALGATISGPSGFATDEPYGIAIDTSGNIWVGGYLSNSIIEVNSATGAVMGTHTVTGLSTHPSALAFDPSGNIWVADEYFSGGSALEFSGTGSFLHQFTTGGIIDPYGVAVDSSGNVWFADNGTSVWALTGYTNAGVPITGSPFTSSGVNAPHGVAVDRGGNLWMAGYNGALVAFNNAGGLVSPAAGYTGGGIGAPYAIKVDGDNNIWIADANNTGAGASEFANDGTVLNGIAPYGIAASSATQDIGIDPSGDVWLTNTGSNSVLEILGVGAPTVTPLATATATGLIGARPTSTCPVPSARTQSQPTVKGLVSPYGQGC